jgi:hypothetical protein
MKQYLIHIDNNEDKCKELQEELFKYGFSWRYDPTTVRLKSAAGQPITAIGVNIGDPRGLTQYFPGVRQEKAIKPGTEHMSVDWAIEHAKDLDGAMAPSRNVAPPGYRHMPLHEREQYVYPNDNTMRYWIEGTDKKWVPSYGPEGWHTYEYSWVCPIGKKLTYVYEGIPRGMRLVTPEEQKGTKFPTDTKVMWLSKFDQGWRECHSADDNYGWDESNYMFAMSTLYVLKNKEREIMIAGKPFSLSTVQAALEDYEG